MGVVHAGKAGGVPLGRLVALDYRRELHLCVRPEVSISVADGRAKLETRVFLGEIPMTPELERRLGQLLEECGVGGWKRRYKLPPDILVLDGEWWRLRLAFADGSARESYGDNVRPEGFERFEVGLLEVFGQPPVE